ncbi:putative lipid II flippase FtsW [Tumebacillus sp. DT12]|uniref:Probable peptidoglycan glycosyltransferase FtsW n=1 Tax=Tumebacillus lacus TaxID=2995335 RepID=A0ABT3WYW6_9BACL|nr:putative lipid II flippase FtsW [Tumebacillus lacus]MCX7569863.1 putative lipid II flippase FtsW [Tumebacillus lacus]
MKVTRHRPDFVLFVVVVLLTLIGLVSIYSASSIVALVKYEQSTAYFFIRQSVWVILGLFVMLFTMNIPFTRWQKLSKLFLLGSYLALILVLIPPFGKEVNGAYRWLKLGPLSFQPSELAIVGIILYLAYLLSKKGDRVQDPKASFWPTMVLTMLGFGLIMLEPDMDTAATYGLCAFIIMFVAGVPGKYLRNTALLAIAAMIPLALYGYRGERLDAYLDPWNNINEKGYQVIQSLYAIGTGGLTGRGLGHSIEKFSYLPEPHTDFIFAVFSEEWGYIGGMVLIVLYGILIWRGIHIATHVQDRFAGLVAVGLTTMIGVAVFLNIGSVTKLLPTIGVPLPFISYGGTSLLFKMFAMGILLNISRYTVQERPEQPARAFDGKGGTSL